MCSIAAQGRDPGLGEGSPKWSLTFDLAAFGLYLTGTIQICQVSKTQKALDVYLVSSPDPTLEEGKGSGEFGHNPWARERNLSAPMRLQL